MVLENRYLLFRIKLLYFVRIQGYEYVPSYRYQAEYYTSVSLPKCGGSRGSMFAPVCKYSVSVFECEFVSSIEEYISSSVIIFVQPRTVFVECDNVVVPSNIFLRV